VDKARSAEVPANPLRNARQIGELAHKSAALLIVEKQRHFSWEGRISLWFDKDSQQLLEGPKAGRRYIDLSTSKWKTEWRPR
jgi:twinkle protein